LRRFGRRTPNSARNWRATSEAERYRASTNEILDTLFPYKPPTDEELAEMFKPEEGKTLQEILAR